MHFTIIFNNVHSNKILISKIPFSLKIVSQKYEETAFIICIQLHSLQNLKKKKMNILSLSKCEKHFPFSLCIRMSGKRILLIFL